MAKLALEQKVAALLARQEEHGKFFAVIDKIRLSKGCSVRDFAKAIGVTPKQYYNWLKGESKTSHVTTRAGVIKVVKQIIRGERVL